MEGTPVYDARKRIGAELAREVGVPTPTWSCRCRIPACPRRWATPTESGIPFELGIIRNHYVGRTFIEPTDHIRHLGVKLKHSANRPGAEGQAGDPGGRFDRARHHQPEDRRDGARGRRARGAYAHFLAADHAFLLLRHRHAGARRAAGRAATAWRRWRELIGADSLAFISIDGLYRALGKRGPRPARPHYCDACFTGDYPIALPDQADNADRQLSLLGRALMPLAMPGPLCRPHRAGHRRQPRHRRGDRRRTGPARRARGDHRPHPGRPGGDRRRDPRRRRRARRCCRWTCARATRSMRSAPACSSASAGWTSWCTPPARWAG